MKTIFFWNQFKKGRTPFWQPWGCMGCLGRLLLFLLLLLLLLFLLSLFRKCENTRDETGSRRGEATEIRWNEPIANGEDVGLPSPEQNVLPPFEESVPNPENNGATEIYPNLLYVIFDAEANDETLKVFGKEFTALWRWP